MPHDAILSIFGLPVAPDLTEADVLRLVQAEIARLLQADRAQLVNLAYRLDIDERRFQACFREGHDPADIASRLSRLFFEREKAKFLHRRNHGR